MGLAGRRATPWTSSVPILATRPGAWSSGPVELPPETRTRVRLPGGAGECLLEAGAVVGQGPEDARQAAVTRDRAPNHHRVHVGNQVPACRRAGRQQLVTGDEDGDAPAGG